MLPDKIQHYKCGTTVINAETSTGRYLDVQVSGLVLRLGVVSSVADVHILGYC